MRAPFSCGGLLLTFRAPVKKLLLIRLSLARKQSLRFRGRVVAASSSLRARRHAARPGGAKAALVQGDGATQASSWETSTGDERLEYALPVPAAPPHPGAQRRRATGAYRGKYQARVFWENCEGHPDVVHGRGYFACHPCSPTVGCGYSYSKGTTVWEIGVS